MHSAQGIVLKKVDVGEADGFFVIYTAEFGKIGAFGQGIKKDGAKLKGHVEKYNLVSIRFVSGRQNERLTHAEAISLWPEIRADLNKLSLASKISDLIDKNCLPGEPDALLWDLILSSFRRIEEGMFSEEISNNFLEEFQEKLSATMGYGKSHMKKNAL